MAASAQPATCTHPHPTTALHAQMHACEREGLRVDWPPGDWRHFSDRHTCDRHTWHRSEPERRHSLSLSHCHKLSAPDGDRRLRQREARAQLCECECECEAVGVRGCGCCGGGAWCVRHASCVMVRARGAPPLPDGRTDTRPRHPDQRPPARGAPPAVRPAPAPRAATSEKGRTDDDGAMVLDVWRCN
jgi:hypothetical protein